MRVLGIEFAGSDMFYVVLDSIDGTKTIGAHSRLSLGETRSRTSLMAFQSAVTTVLVETAPDLIAIKAKPENGSMRAGAAALKMEGVVLANCRCEVEFVSGARINKAQRIPNDLYAYLQPALKAAAAAAG